MTQEVLIVGANGRIGRWALEAFCGADWKVRAFVRGGSGSRVRNGVTVFEGDAFDANAVTAAAEGVDVIVNALNPPYEHWATDVPKITNSILTAARATGATVVIPGNVYNYGEGMPGVLREDTPHTPSTRKGELREQMEQTYREAAAEGVQTIVVRAGDYIEHQQTGNWFDTYITNKVSKGVICYPGQLDRVHSWAYLPDVGRAMVGLADQRESLGSFESFGFAGFSLTGQELVEALQVASGRKLKVKAFPWTAVRALGIVSAAMREVVEMRYLWDVPHGIDGAKLEEALPDFEPTDLTSALRNALHVETPEATDPATHPIGLKPRAR